MNREKLNPLDRLYGAYLLTKVVARIAFAGLPHLLESKNPNEIVERVAFTDAILSRVGQEPVAKLESEIQEKYGPFPIPKYP